MLTEAQKEEYERVGAIVVPDVLTPEEVAEIVRFLAYMFAPVGLIVAVCSRIRFVLLCCVRIPLI